jgi:uncharacterized protein YegP (UPF0339 family)
MPTIRVYQSADGWRWRMVAPNGRVIADSGEAYSRRGNALRAATKFLDAAQNAVVVKE